MAALNSEAKIKRAGGCAIFCGVVTLAMMVLLSEVYDEMFGAEDLGLLKYVDVILIFGLAFGIFLKSRVCAWTMFLYFTGSKLWMWQETGNVRGIGVAAVFIYFFFQGALGTLEYHRDRRRGYEPDDELEDRFRRPLDPPPVAAGELVRRLVATGPIEQGDRIREDMLEIQRTDLQGLDASQWDRVVGTVAGRPIGAGEVLRQECLTG